MIHGGALALLSTTTYPGVLASAAPVQVRLRPILVRIRSVTFPAEAGSALIADVAGTHGRRPSVGLAFFT